MTLKRYLAAMTLSTVGCWLAFITVLFYIDPQNSGIIGPTSFYISLFLALIGTFSLFGFFIRLLIHKQDLPHYHIGVSLRQATLLAILLLGSLLLLGNRLFLWWSVLSLFAGLIILEFFFLTSKKPNRYKRE